MNIKWNEQNIINELKELEREYYAIENFSDRAIIAYTRQAYISILNGKSDIFPLENINEYYYYTQNQFEQQKNNIAKIMTYERKKYFGLFNNMSNIKIKKINIDKNNFVIDSKLIGHIKNFAKAYDINLYNHFNYIYNNGYINIATSKNGDYNGFCVCLNHNKKSYIFVFAKNNYYVAPVISHELGHSYEVTLDRKDKSWIYSLNIYNEVFAIFLELLFDKYIYNTKYYNQALSDYQDFFTTNYYMAGDLKNILKFNYQKSIDFITDFIYSYNSNIAIAFLEQYNIDKKEGKKNIDYFLHNYDLLYSDKLLQSVDIDLNKLYAGDYYSEYYKKVKKLIK